METTVTTIDRATEDIEADPVALKLEVVVIPVADPDRSKAFYAGLGWRLDADFSFDNGFRVVQFTPPGSPASLQFGSGLTTAAPGSAQGNYLVVADIAAARADLVGHGVDASAVFHPAAPGAQFGDDPTVRITGSDPDSSSYRSFVTFSDPDGNRWLLQEVTSRLPGRVDPAATSFGSVGDLSAALRRAAVAHGEHEQRNGGRYDENWPAWYATYMVAEQSGAALPE